MTQSIGTGGFYTHLATLLAAPASGADFLVLQRAVSQPRPKVRFHQLSGHRLSTWRRLDRLGDDGEAVENPIYQRLNNTCRNGNFIVRICDEDIKRPAWFARSGISKALILALNCDDDLAAIVLFARAPVDDFSTGQIDRISQLGAILLPLLKLHFRLIDTPVRDSWMSVEAMEKRVRLTFPELTKREMSVCARSALGVTAEGIGIDLGIKKSSVLTYRRRAYARLNVSSIHQLSTMLIQSSQPQHRMLAQ